MHTIYYKQSKFIINNRDETRTDYSNSVDGNLPVSPGLKLVAAL